MSGEQQPQELPAGGAPEPADNRKVTVRGRIGGFPIYRTLQETDVKPETLVANFSLAEHPDPADRAQTVWHTIVAFGPRAQQVQEQFADGLLSVGAEIEVVGYTHRRERPTKEGGTRLVEEIYAAAIRRPVQPAATTDSSAAPERRETPPTEPAQQ